jgi:hypothetical protein
MAGEEALARLRNAVAEVIRQNRSVGYNPQRFINMVSEATGAQLVAVCERLLLDERTFAAVTMEVWENPAILTMEEVIARDPDPSSFGLSDTALRSARQRAEQLVAYRRQRSHR